MEKEKEIKQEQPVEEKTGKLAKAAWMTDYLTNLGPNWTADEVDRMEVSTSDDFKKVVSQCRFFYKKDPIAGTVINKMVELGITDILFDKKGISANEYRIYEAIKSPLKEFMENCALEFLISGLVIPEIKYQTVGKEKLSDFGIKKYSALTLPTSMWIRDPSTVKIKSFMVLDEPSYFIEIPMELVMFIQTEGTYGDGTKDPELYQKLLALYPEFVAQVRSGKREMLLDNDLIVRRKVLSNCPYPIPYLYSSLESLKHKRNLRRMDYSLASRVISAIQLIKLGNDEFPLVEGDEGSFDDIKKQMTYRYSGNKDIERIFQLFANHTLEIEWIFPDVTSLLDDKKYDGVNQDIFFGLGFPRILTTGETEKSNTSDEELAMESPIGTMKNIQEKLLPILKSIVNNVCKQNGLTNVPNVKFEKLNLKRFSDFITGLKELYASGNLSRDSYAKVFGYEFEEEIEKREEEEKMLAEKEIPQFAPIPFSTKPETEPTEGETKTKETHTKTTSKTKTKEKNSQN